MANITAMIKEGFVITKTGGIPITRWYQAYALHPGKYYTGHTNPAVQD